MSDTPVPEEINFNPKTRVLELGYADGNRFQLPCEYLRVYSPSVEVSGMGELTVYKEDVYDHGHSAHGQLRHSNLFRRWP